MRMRFLAIRSCKKRFDVSPASPTIDPPKLKCQKIVETPKACKQQCLQAFFVIIHINPLQRHGM